MFFLFHFPFRKRQISAMSYMALVNRSDEGLMLKTSALRWQIYVINSVDNTKLPCYTLPSTQHHSFFRNLPLLLIYSAIDFRTYLKKLIKLNEVNKRG